MRIKIKILFVILFINVSWAISQNLVPNNGFEDAWSCPVSFVTLPIAKPYPQWYNPNKGTPDQLHICSAYESGIPKNFAGEMYPSEGGAYAGIILREVFYDTTKIVNGVSREYIQTKLCEPLKRDKLYCVKLFYANSSKSLYAVDALGITLTSDRIGTKDAGLIIQRPQIINKPGNIMDNIDYWQELCGIYRAGGNEEYLTIGNFWDNAITNYKQNEFESTDSNFVFAYYYIDDVRVFEIENEFECGCLNNLSFGSDWMSDKYDPETGYNTLNSEDLTLNDLANNDLDDFNSDSNANQNENDGGENDANGDNVNENDGGNNGSENDGGNNGNENDGLNSSILTMKTSEINDEAFKNAKIGDKFNLNRIFFEFNSYDLLTASYTELDRLYEILIAKPSLKIEIRGHTDNVGSISYNKKLSVKRAASVYDYLIDKGIVKSRMKYRGFGNKVPIADNETEDGRKINRRVEIIIVGL